MRNDPQGSNWRKWDLHVHTPESIIHYYPGQPDDAWREFLDDLERLPPEYKVLGINDYIFLDGYRRIIKEKAAGRLRNIETIFPVIELRIEMFGGSEKLRRLNYHVVFSDELDADLIQSQFVNGLEKEYFLNGKKLAWNSIPTPDSLATLGQKIYDSTPTEKQNTLPSSKVELGFNNLNFSLESVRKRLRNTEFDGKHLTAIGRTEWHDFPWTNQFIADKKSLIEHVDFVFAASKTKEDYARCQANLSSNQVNDKLLQASDAHALSTSNKPNKIGNCMTWIKADTTFQGLRQALKRFDQRVFVGDLPHKHVSVAESPGKYVRGVSLRKIEKKFQEKWFENVSVSFNHGLSVVIGNKGSAKSALTDIVGLLGNSTCEEGDFSFLHKDKFRAKPENKSRYFEGTLVWEDSNPSTKSLDSVTAAGEIEQLKYIPQKYFEKICNEIDGEEDSKFDIELKNVIFSHVRPEDRLGLDSLRAVLDYRTEEIDKVIGKLSSELKKLNADIASKQELLRPEHKKSLDNKLATKNQELVTHRKAKPVEVPDPSVGNEEPQNLINQQIVEHIAKTKELDTEIEKAERRLAQLNQDVVNLEKAKNKIEYFRSNFNEAREDFNSLGLAGVDFDKIVTMSVDMKPLEDLEKKVAVELTDIKAKLDKDSPTSLVSIKTVLATEIEALQKSLNEPNKAYQAYRRKLKTWEAKELVILEGADDSIKFFNDQLTELKALPKSIEDLEAERRNLATRIHEQIVRKVSEFKTLYTAVQEFIHNHPLAKEFNLEFDVSIVNKGFEQRFFDWIDQGSSGSFHGRAAGMDRLEKLISEYDFNSSSSALQFADEIVRCLTRDLRDAGEPERQISEQLKQGKTVASIYDFIFSFKYLHPHFVLRMLGKDMPQLSPGEKGSLLLVFYLLIDKGTVPLIIDQPEENLDNETIVKLLVPAVQEAKARRQVIIVTHNPNLAIVCDADQIIRAHLKKEDRNEVVYVSGSIENPEMNAHVVDVLEGTSRAFKIRSETYELN